MHLGLARRQVDAARTDDASVALTTVQRELHRMDRLLSRLIELEERGRAVIRPHMVDIGAVVNAAVADTLSAEPGAPNVVLDLGERIVGGWDAAAVEEIVRNLLSNAIRFGERRPVRIKVESNQKSAHIVVTDRGRGIAAADHARIFARGTHAPRRQGGGLGLGLWLVKQLARGHGGRVTLKSRPGHGATFTVTLPQRRPRPTSTPEQATTREEVDDLRRPDFSSSRLLVFARHLMRATDVGAILAAAGDEVKAVAGYQHVWLLVADREDLDQLRLIEYAGSLREVVWETAPLFNVKGDKFLEHLVASDGPVVIEDARTDPRTDKRLVEQLQNRTLINVPLRLLDRPLGIFGIGTFGDDGCRAPSPREVDHFVAIAAQVAVALARIRLGES